MRSSQRKHFRLSSFLNLIRALFPTWNFFDQVQYQFGVEIKVPDLDRWEPLSFNQSRQAFNMALNGSANLAMAQVNVIEHFARDIQELLLDSPLVESRQVRSLTSFKLISALLKVKMQEYEVSPNSLQFKVVAIRKDEILDIYISDWIPCSVS